MLKTKQVARRANVTIDDRRAVLMATKGKLAELAKKGIKVEDHVRRELKSRMGWPQTEPAPQCVKDAAKHIATTLSGQAKAEAEAKAKKAADAKKAEEDKAKTAAVEGV